ncbi:hypothetical protein Sjap_016059 [Stephania japonica]|uniref:Uncharacterized protein n=1 Tax=Stephania japonica TaxID=461633 RepID=A0AAP0NRH1_9MAGN
MILDWLSQSTTKQPLQEDVQHTIPNLQNSKTQVIAILEYLIDEEKSSPQPISDSEETVNAATLESNEFDEFSIVDDTYDEVEKDIESISEWLEEPQKESKEDQLMVLNHVLEVPDELLNLKEGIPTELPKVINASFIVDISKGEGIT